MGGGFIEPVKFKCLNSNNQPNVVYISAQQFITEIYPSIVPWHQQRVINMDHVKTLFLYQQNLLSKGLAPIVVGCFSTCIINNTRYLVDGQHRLEMLKLLYNDDANCLNNTIICIQEFQCVNMLEGESIYLLANNTYNVNSSICNNEVIPNLSLATRDVANEVVDSLKSIFGMFIQNGKPSAPYIDIGTFVQELNKSGIISRKTSGEIVEAIIAANNNYKIILQNKSNDQYKRCSTGFVLPYMEPKCRWINKI